MVVKVVTDGARQSGGGHNDSRWLSDWRSYMNIVVIKLGSHSDGCWLEWWLTMVNVMVDGG
jgi:hypothetical protein